MNGLSWAIYLVGLVEKVADGLSFILPFSCIAFVAGLAATIIMTLIKQSAMTGGYYHNAITKEQADERYAGISKVFSKILKCGLTVAIVAIVVDTFIPTKQTMVLIAASEVSEAVVTNDVVTKTAGEIGGLGFEAMTLLKDYIKSESIDINAEIESKLGAVKDTVQTAKDAAEAAKGAAETVKELAK